MRLLATITFIFLSALTLISSQGAVNSQEANSLNILTYNTFLRAPTWVFFRDKQTARTNFIPNGLHGYDIVVLQETFSNKHRKQIVNALQDEYPYQTTKLGIDRPFNYNGGVLIMSRWPILSEDQTVFSICDGSDCMVKKGVVYSKINKLGKTYHLFGLHLQAQVEYADARIAQFPEIRDFINAQNIPADEPLLIAGDFNVNYFTRDEDDELDSLLNMLNVEFYEQQPEATFSSETNSILDDEVKERVDYIFYSENHLQPSSATTEVIFIREGNRDLSDHHGVAGQFHFGSLE